MIKRNGFVSNSSSSSFFIFVKNKDKNLNILNEKICEIFDVKENSFWYDMSKDFIECIKDNSKEYNVKQLMKEYGADDMEELQDCFPEEIKKYINHDIFNNWNFYRGEFSENGSEPIEQFFCNNYFFFENDEILICGGGGY